MSLLKKWFSGHVETRDAHTDQTLTTRYYKTTKDKLYRHILDMVKKNSKMELIDASDERGEISVNVKGKRKSFLVITVISVRPFRTAVDFSVSIDGGINFGYGHRLIEELYKKISADFTLAD